MKKKILCIDDSLTARLLMEFALNDAGYETFTAQSVEEARELIKNHVPDLILLDLSMPDVSGFDFLNMKDQFNLGNVKIIVISAYDSQESVETTKKLGVVDFISKPIKVKDVLERIRMQLDQS
jgi:DNA-binding response OmpR family regulator